MGRKIKTMYVVHHSHTDIGYTDLQEHVIDTHIHYIRSVLSIMSKEENQAFRWNCETYFCVEAFLKEASAEEKEAFFNLVRQNKIGLSAMYLNFNDLVDYSISKDRLAEMIALFKAQNIIPCTAMCADVNGISMGLRDAMLDHGIEFLFTNIHCHHGMYPLYQNQTAYWWENAEGKKLLVWNGEHYNLGNALGIKPNRSANFMIQNYFGNADFSKPLMILRENIQKYLLECNENGYPYDFIISGVSGVFSDNAPPETEILHMIEEFNRHHSDIVVLKMVSLQELYLLIRNQLANAPVVRGDLTDWWANGVGSTPYAVKHYKDALRRYHLCRRLNAGTDDRYTSLMRVAQDHLLLYAEHTWGHSSTITCPYDTMVLNLDMRKNSYASKAHEAASRVLNKIAEDQGDIRRYYDTSGKIKVCNVNGITKKQIVEFYIESPFMQNAQVTSEDGQIIPCQVSPHPRGRRISFVDQFSAYEEKYYSYQEIPALPKTLNSRIAYIGSERVRDIINDYDKTSYRLPYSFENKWFAIQYKSLQGVSSFVNKKTNREMLRADVVPFFTPIYECTKVRSTADGYTYDGEAERRILGRNIRGRHANLFIGELQEVVCLEQGEVFTTIEFRYTLPGTIHCSVFLKLYEEIPQIDFRIEIGKTLSADIESIFLAMSLSLGEQTLYLKKGTEAVRPGIDQIPGTCMEYYMSDHGLAYVTRDESLLIATKDAPLLYMGEMQHHPIRLCDNQLENNQRPLYSWIMNNTWETNFKMDLSGFCEYLYSLRLDNECDPEKAMNLLEELEYSPVVYITE